MQRFVATKKTVEGIAVGNSSCFDGCMRDSSNTGLNNRIYLILKRLEDSRRASSAAERPGIETHCH